MLTVNKFLACTPFEKNSIKTEVKHGVPLISQKQKLLQLTVVFDSDEGYHTGDKIWVKGEVCTHQSSKEVLEINGKSFILVPVSLVICKEPGDRRYQFDYESKEKY